MLYLALPHVRAGDARGLPQHLACDDGQRIKPEHRVDGPGIGRRLRERCDELTSKVSKPSAKTPVAIRAAPPTGSSSEPLAQLSAREFSQEGRAGSREPGPFESAHRLTREGYGRYASRASERTSLTTRRLNENSTEWPKGHDAGQLLRRQSRRAGWLSTWRLRSKRTRSLVSVSRSANRHPCRFPRPRSSCGRTGDSGVACECAAGASSVAPLP